MNAKDEESLKKLLHDALPVMEDEPEVARDLWSAMLQRLHERSVRVPWFDWALLAGLVGVVAVFPAAIPMLLFYL
jgi:hypothetical protein